ncbi:MAG: aldehyde dehydrogenase [Planctomycetota bacterium]|nr:MAG: aldehyde dehydrogenase [Planctomycetota bacterium]
MAATDREGGTAEQVREQVAHALQRARAAQARWASTSPRERARVLRGARERLRAGAEAAVAALASDLGKPPHEALTTEVVADVELFDWWCRHAPRLLAPRRVRLDPLHYPGKRAWIERAPAGVLGLITPWNLPVAIPLRTIVPALLAGDAVVWKPSELAPASARFVASLFTELLPADLLVVLPGAPAYGAALAAAGCDRLCFTGSAATGRKVARAAAETLTPVSLELGGKDAAIVCADVDLERAARGIVWAAFYNAGQNCAALQRCYVERAIYERFEERVVALARTLRAGPGGELPPLASPAQLERVAAQLEDAQRRGARVLCGAQRHQERWYLPTVLAEVPPDALVLQEETFGPVLSLVAVANAEEAVAQANASPYGLTASIWTRDLARARALARRLAAGVVTVNNHAFTGALPMLPWGGLKASGHGVTSSPHALEHLTQPRAVVIDRGQGPGDVWWYPYTETLLELARGSLRLLGGGLGRLAALPRLLGALRRRQRELCGEPARPGP